MDTPAPIATLAGLTAAFECVRAASRADPFPSLAVRRRRLDALAALVVEAFSGQFTVDQLNNGTDIGEMLAVLNLIVSKARTGMGGNPTPPGM